MVRAEDMAGAFAKDGVRAVTVSLGGYGESVRFLRPLDDSDLRHAEDLVEFTRKLPIPRGADMILFGTSRGAGICLMAAALGARCNGVVAAGGALDWRRVYETTDNDEMRLWLSRWTEEDLERNSAAKYAERISVPVRLEIGEFEDWEIRRQNAEFAGALRSAGTPVDAVDVPGAGHAYFDTRFRENWGARMGWLNALAGSGGRG